jgi:elongation factor Tu
MSGHADYVKQTTEHVLLARQVGVEHLVVALNKAKAAAP